MKRLWNRSSTNFWRMLFRERNENDNLCCIHDNTFTDIKVHCHGFYTLYHFTCLFGKLCFSSLFFIIMLLQKNYIPKVHYPLYAVCL